MALHRFKRVCVFCGSSDGFDPAYLAVAGELGTLLATRGVDIVYGGARVGMMGALADAALKHQGKVIGVMPERLRAKEIAHDGLTELFVVDSMHARKAMMAHLSDAFIALPGGFGTLEELFEVVTWTQLRYHVKPVGLVNLKGYYDPLLRFVDHAVVEGFIREEHRPLLLSAERPSELLSQLESVELPELAKWIDRP